MNAPPRTGPEKRRPRGSEPPGQELDSANLSYAGQIAEFARQRNSLFQKNTFPRVESAGTSSNAIVGHPEKPESEVAP
jgi:hypothetical protein